MYLQEISININTGADPDEAVDAFGLLLAYYKSNGQLQGEAGTQYIHANRITALVHTAETCALDSRYNNSYVTLQRQKVETLCKATFEYNVKGKTYESDPSPCTCDKSDFYILMTHYLSIESPLSCGNCAQAVPLYRLPAYYDDGYKPILSWVSNYQSCDTLQMNCEVGERWALNQMQELHSALSRQGRAICTQLETLTGIPAYYYLHNYRKYKGDDPSRRCPGCGSTWSLKMRLHRFFDFKCEDCRLLSTFSPNT